MFALLVGTSQLVEHLIEMPGTTPTQVRVPGAARDFSPRVRLPAQTLLQHLYSPLVQSHASVYVRVLKILQTCCCSDIRKYEDMTHTDRSA